MPGPNTTSSGRTSSEVIRMETLGRNARGPGQNGTANAQRPGEFKKE